MSNGLDNKEPVVSSSSLLAAPEPKPLIILPEKKEEQAEVREIRMAVYGVPPKHGPKLGASSYRRLIYLNHPGGKHTVQMGVSPVIDGFNQAQITFTGNRGHGVCDKVAVAICDQLRDHPSYKVD